MSAVDTTYPLYPIALILASIMLFLVLTTSIVRQSWNLGVTFLCFWLFLECVTEAADAIIWSDTADVKLYVYCDIVSHLQYMSSILKPMATLLITRRLYLIANLQAVDLPGESARRWNLAVEWTLGLIVPLMIVGPVYYVNQGSRFFIEEGFGCTTSEYPSVLDVLISQSWTVIPPLVSVIFYYPNVIRTYYQQRKDINSFLHSNPSVSHTNYIRILAIGSIDLLLTLPIGIVTITLEIIGPLSSSAITFYPGWSYLHAEWEPESISYAYLQASGNSILTLYTFEHWTSPVLAFAIFGLFGLTSEARASYWRIICKVGGWLGWKPSPRAHDGQTALGEIGARRWGRNTFGFDLETGSRTPSFIDPDERAMNHGAGPAPGEGAGGESDVDLKSVEEARHTFERINDSDIQMVGRHIHRVKDESAKETQSSEAADGALRMLREEGGAINIAEGALAAIV